MSDDRRVQVIDKLGSLATAKRFRTSALSIPSISWLTR